MGVLSRPLSLVWLLTTASLVPSIILAHAAPPNPDQLYALQQSAYLAAASSARAVSTLPSSPRRRHPTTTVDSDSVELRSVAQQNHVKSSSDRKNFHREIRKSLDKKRRKNQVDHELGTKSSSSNDTEAAEGNDHRGGVKRRGRMEKLRRRTHDRVDRPFPHGVPEFDVQKLRMGPASSTNKDPETLKSKSLVRRRGGTFKGVSSYYLFALDDGPRRAVLDAIKAGGFSVVRIFMSGVHGNCKGSGNGAVPDLEPDKVGEYDDTILFKIDKLMADCADRGLKLIIALSDRYALGFWSTNSYAVQLSIIQPSQQGAQSLKIKNAGAFYSNSWAIKMFEQRMNHALNHENQLMGGQKWKDLSSVVYAFEAQNEPQGYMDASNPSWVCDRSDFIASQVSGSGIQVSSGGGVDVSTSLQGWATNCGSIDIVSVHDYGTNGWNTAGALAKAQNNHPDKTIMMGEWGLTGSNKAAKISEFISAFESKGIPWMYWQVTQPGAGSEDFEVWTSEPAWEALTGGSYSYSLPGGGTSKGSNGGYQASNGSKSSAVPLSSSKTISSVSPANSTFVKTTKASSINSTSTTVADDGSQKATVASASATYSTISPDQLSAYSIVSEPTPASSPSSQIASATSSVDYPSPSVQQEAQYLTLSSDNLSGYSIVADASPSAIESSIPVPLINNSTLIGDDAAQPSGDTSTSDVTDPTIPSVTADDPLAANSSLSDSSTSTPDASVQSAPLGDSGLNLPTPANDIPSVLENATVSADPSTSGGTSNNLVAPQDPISPSGVPTTTDPTGVSATPTLGQIPLPIETAADGSLIPFSNCNYTEAQVLDGTVHIDVNNTIILLPSGIYCNTTILPQVLNETPLPTPSPSVQAAATPLLVFSSDPSTILPEFSSDVSPPETPSTTIAQENETAPLESPTPSPVPGAQDFQYVTLDANALVTMDLSGYSILPA